MQCLCCRIALCLSSPPEAKALWEDKNESRSPLRYRNNSQDGCFTSRPFQNAKIMRNNDITNFFWKKVVTRASFKKKRLSFVTCEVSYLGQTSPRLRRKSRNLGEKYISLGFTDFAKRVIFNPFWEPASRGCKIHLPAYGRNPEILDKIDFSRISRFREAGDIHPLLRACLFETVEKSVRYSIRALG